MLRLAETSEASKISDDTIPSRFERWAAVAPDRLAIVTDEGSLTYRELDAKAARIAASLSSLSLPRERPIVLTAEDELARVAAMLGMLKAGHMIVPLAYSTPPGRVSQVLADSGATHVIADRATFAAAKAIAPSATILNAEELSQSANLFVSDFSQSADAIAYIVYTSGSTGLPKGVLNSHRGAIRRSDVRMPVYGISAGAACANLRSGATSAGITMTFLPLVAGSTLYPFDLHRQGLQKLSSWFVKHEINFVSFSSSLFRAWLATLSEDFRLPHMRVLEVTGEALFAQDVMRASRHLEGDWRIAHSYSSTESGTVAAQVFTPAHLPDSDVIPVGRPLANVEAWIENEAGERLPSGAVGEIVIQGPGVSHGYWNNEELTAKVFRKGAGAQDARIYRTGDIGRFRPDGVLEHLGRTGRRLRIRGYSVEPFEVECALRCIPGVRDAAVLLQKADNEEGRLVGYVIAGSDMFPSAIRSALAQQLPAQMVPSDIVILDAFPTLASGKVDRASLPAPARRASESVASRAPSNDIETVLVEIWKDVLKRETISVDDDFYDLGGTSLQAFLVFSQIAKRLSRDLPPTIMLEASTIAKLAAVLTQATHDVPPSLIAFREHGTQAPLFVVHARLGNIMFVKNIVQDLKSDRPVYGIQPPPLDGKRRLAKTIEAIAAGYLADLRQVQKMGPYYLAGYSWGGRLALEIAQQLTRQGERVAFLGLIDTVLDTMYVVGGEDAAARARRHVREMRRASIIPYVTNRLIQTAKYYRFRAGEIADYLPHYLRMQLGLPIPYSRRLDVYSYALGAATRRYTVQPYSGHITMFAAENRAEQQRSRWSRIAQGGLTVYEMTGLHFDMVEPPHSTGLAARLDESLEKASA